MKEKLILKWISYAVLSTNGPKDLDPGLGPGLGVGCLANYAKPFRN